jgi:hypothetical protein
MALLRIQVLKLQAPAAALPEGTATIGPPWMIAKLLHVLLVRSRLKSGLASAGSPGGTLPGSSTRDDIHWSKPTSGVFTQTYRALMQ